MNLRRLPIHLIIKKNVLEVLVGLLGLGRADKDSKFTLFNKIADSFLVTISCQTDSHRMWIRFARRDVEEENNSPLDLEIFREYFLRNKKTSSPAQRDFYVKQRRQPAETSSLP